MRRLFFLLTVLALLLTTAKADAHGLGQSFKKEVDNYTVEFEYEEPEIIEGEAAGYVFRLLQKDGGAPVVFDSVFVNVEDKEGRAVFTGRIGQDKIQEGVGRATLTLNGGVYTFNLSFQKGEETLAKASFDQEVEVDKEKQQKQSAEKVGAVVLGAVAGFGVAKLLAKRKDVE